MAKPRDPVACPAPHFSRRSLLMNHAPALVAALAIPPLLTACGADADQQASGGGSAPAGETAKSAKPRARKRESAEARSRRDADDGESGADSRADDGEASLEDAADAEQPRAGGASDEESGVEPADSAQDAPGDDAVAEEPRQSEPPVTQTNVMGATPDGGFFSNGAPRLTREQIMAGERVLGKAEGGLHDLVIEPEHLQALARGEKVTIKSSTHTHVGNPTVHNHSVTYTPLMA